MECSEAYLSELENSKKKPSSAFVFRLSSVLFSSTEFILEGKEPHDPAFEGLSTLVLKYGKREQISLFAKLLRTCLCFHAMKLETIEEQTVMLKVAKESSTKTDLKDIERDLHRLDRTKAKSERTMQLIGAALRKFPLL